MAHVSEIRSVEVFRFPDIGGDKLLVLASGEVRTSGWSRIRLSPRYSAVPPADGLLELDFEGDPPGGPVLEVMLPVTAQRVIAAPDWFKGVKAYAAGGSITVTDVRTAALARGPGAEAAATLKPRTVLFRQDLVSYDDSFNPIGLCGGFSVHMKKLHHTLTLVIEGPDEAKIRRCVAEATGVGLVAAIVAVYITGGGALSAAVSAFIGHLEGCLGDAFSVRIDDHSDWVEWCT
jgi:hypothetical protein